MQQDLGYVTRDKWGAPVPVATAPVPAEAPKVAEAAKPAETPKVEEAAKPVEQQVATAQPPAEVASEPAAPAVQPPAAETPKPDVAVPSFDTVRIEPDGSAVIAGRAAPGSEVTVKLNGAVVATGTANADGAFAIVPDKPMPAGAGVLSLEMKSADGKMASSEQTVAVAGKATGEAAPTVAILKPDAPTKIIQSGGTEAAKLPPMASVNIDAVDYDEQGNMVFGGRGPAGNKVQLYMDNQPLAEGVIGADGTWTIAPTAQIAVGAHALRADEIGNDGAVKSRVEIPFFREEAAKVLASRAPAPEQPATKTEETTVTVTTPDKQTTVTATAPVTVEVKEEPAKPAEVAAAEPAKLAETAAAEPSSQWNQQSRLKRLLPNPSSQSSLQNQLRPLLRNPQSLPKPLPQNRQSLLNLHRKSLQPNRRHQRLSRCLMPRSSSSQATICGSCPARSMARASCTR